MRVALVNLISTPAAVLPRLGLDLSIGLSSEDPVVGRHPSEPYDVYLSVYAPDGAFAGRLELGRIAPHRRELFGVSALVRPFRFDDNHLVVVQRVPASLADRYGAIDTPVDLPAGTDYLMFRAYVQYGYTGGGDAHGGVIYEIPERFNEPVPGKLPPAVLTFTTKIVISVNVDTHVVLLNCSTNPGHRTTADYAFAIYTGVGVPVAAGRCAVPPFGLRVLDLRDVIPDGAVVKARDVHDGLSHFCLYGICEDATVAIIVLNLAPALGGLSVEHTHPTQAYLMAETSEAQQRIKRNAITAWRRVIASVAAQ